MSLAVQKGVFTPSLTTGGTITVNLPGGFDLKALILFTGQHTAEADLDSSGQMAIGFVTKDGGTIQQGYMAYADADGQGLADTHSAINWTDVTPAAGGLTGMIGTGAVDFQLDVTTFSATQFIVTSTNPPASAIIVHYLALGGSDITAARVSGFTCSTGVASQDITVASGFGQPDLIMMLSAEQNTLGAIAANGQARFAVAKSATERRVADLVCLDGPTNMDLESYQGDLFLALHNSTGALTCAADLDAKANWPADGFRLAYATQAPSASRNVFLALKGTFESSIGSGAIPTSGAPVNQDFVVEQDLKAAIVFGNSEATTGSVVSSGGDLGGFYFGATDGTTEGSCGVAEDHGQPSSFAGRFHSESKVYRTIVTNGGGPVVQSAADSSFVGADTDTLRLTWTDTDTVARAFSFLTLSGANIPLVGTVNTVSETAAAQPIVAPKRAALNTVTESDVAQPLAVPATRLVGRVTGADVARPIHPLVPAPPVVVTFPVRERVPLRVSVDIETPYGRHHRWADDEPDAENVPSGLTWGDAMPGGFESCECVLPRLHGVDYPDLDPMSTLRVLSAGGRVVGEYRLERTPRTSGNHMAINPGAVGWQAAMDDNKSVRIIFVDREIGSWGNWPAADKKQLLDSLYDIAAGSWAVENGALVAALRNEELPASWATRAWYIAPAGVRIAIVEYQGTEAGVPAPYDDAAFTFSPGDTILGGDTYPAILDGNGRSIVAATPRRYVSISQGVTGSVQTPPPGAHRTLTKLAAYGDHGLPLHVVPGAPDGMVASDIVAYAVEQYAPKLKVDGSITPSSFVIEHMAFRDVTTVSEIVHAASRFELQDWAVWENKTFWWHPRGARGRHWRARVAPAQLEEAGPQIDRIWESVVVQYQDVDGSTRTTGPPGSGADTEVAALRDTDPQNPANELGITRRALLSMGTSTAAGAAKVGERFLQEQKTLNQSGRAQLTGHVEDDHGVLHPYHAVRSGDTISFIDAADTSPRRIVKSEKSADSRSCAVELDSPPEALAALLERLGAVLEPLGIT